MSIQILKLELESRNGRELFPQLFPMGLLIGFTRELALADDGTLSIDELGQLSATSTEYFRRIMEMQGKSRLDEFDGRYAELVGSFLQELYDFMRNEIVSRLIGYDINKSSLRERFFSVLDTAQTDDQDTVHSGQPGL
ncbi:hypothetical protein [Duganella sp. LjRoot269]|uniref:hypothetical protein n=1 Tax=Duganella sp. LjRoot269 TaxID=3342305 RepID=UPI003ECF4CBA